MQPIPKSQLRDAGNWSIPDQLIDQFPAAVVVVNCPPFRGALMTCRARHRNCTRALPRALTQAAICYGVSDSAERIDHENCSRSTRAKPRGLLMGGAHGMDH